ncbi:MAG: acyl--CoA ligase [Omnitrophica bacterium]|nr:acyl--CoA ligase [Candidatus Omnitrophota bacterium]
MAITGRLIEIYLRKIKGLNLPRDLIKYAVKRNSCKTAVVDGGRELTYKELYERANKLANALLGMGIGKGDKLALLIYNCREYFEVRIATYLTGIVLVPIVWDMAPEDIIFILNDCEIKALAYHPEILGGNIERVKRETRVKEFIEIGIEYEKLLSKNAPIEPKIKIKEDDLASINFSSGTTGRPKGVSLSQKSWANSFYNYALNSSRAWQRALVFLHVLSFATAGSTVFLMLFFVGATSVILRKFNPEEALSLIVRNGVNATFITPSIFIDILDYCKKNALKLPLYGIAIGTEPMPQAKFKEGVEFFGPIIQTGYGMVEALPPLSLLCSHDYIRDGKLDEALLLSAGKALRGVGLKITDESGKVLPAGKTGRIAVKSNTVSLKYWNNPDLTRMHYKGGWFYTNDYGYIDGNGYLYVSGRSDNILFAREIEETLHGHPAILRCCAFKKYEKIITCVSLKSGSGDVSSEGLIKFCESRLKKGTVPNVINVNPELPINASGKLDRKKISKNFSL